jgi:hypothetical protein
LDFPYWARSGEAGTSDEVTGPPGFPLHAHRSRREGDFILRRMRRFLGEFGSDLSHAVRLDQYYPVPRAVGGRRIVVDVLMRGRRQTGGPNSACHTQCRFEKGPGARHFVNRDMTQRLVAPPLDFGGTPSMCVVVLQ